MFRDMSIQRKLYAGFGAIVLILLTLLISVYRNSAALTEANARDRNTLQTLVQRNSVEALVLDIQAEFRGFLLTGNEQFLSRLDDNVRALEQHYRRLETLLADNAAQQERMRRTAALSSEYVQGVVLPLIEKRRALNQAPDASAAMANDPLLSQGFRYVTQMQGLLRSFDEEENRLHAERERRTTALRDMLFTLLLAGGMVAVLAAVGIALSLARAILSPLSELTSAFTAFGAGNREARARVLQNDEFGRVAQEFNRTAQALQDNEERERRMTDELRAKVDSLLGVVTRAAAGDLTGRVTVGGSDAIGQLGDALARMFDNLRRLIDRVQKAGIQVTTSTTEIAASARQQEGTGVEQAQTSVEVLSTTKEISANSAQLVKTMEEVRHVADYTATATTDAQGSLRHMDSTMQRMVSATDGINDKLAALSEKASKINNVLTTIAKVADQTNILSLNAAIEAEKAGEAGRGFSVVATEIRRLADQTSVATWDIEQMLKEMQSAVSASVMGMDKFSDEIRRSATE
ncbi:MAG TPA: methyl-accepting chemotaxis protein, partial [Noviherbaspirillum sp.]|nr:methyl-accepting chemotaxis protein [Noviherbaspirillum sp.]